MRDAGAPPFGAAHREPDARATQAHGGRRRDAVGIARKYDTTVESLRRANSLDEDDQIRPGQKLRIPD
jgi:nucleoid-associated protein YgaU